MSTEKSKFTEERFNAIVAACMWSSSWVVAAAFLVVLLGVKVPDHILDAFLWTVAVIAPLFLTIGMYQVWRMPDGRKWWAIAASVFLVMSAVLMFGSAVQENRAQEYQKALKVARESVAWQTARARYDAAMADYLILSARTFPADFPTWFAQNEKAKALKWVIVENESSAVAALEPVPVKNAGSVFDIFGPDAAWIVFSVFLVLYSVVNEGTAMSLSHRTRRKSTAKAGETAQGPASSTAGPLAPLDIPGYIAVAMRLGTAGKLAGARMVAAATGHSEWTCKKVLEEAIALGKIKRPENGRPPEAIL
jgi:hypothetical protein